MVETGIPVAAAISWYDGGNPLLLHADCTADKTLAIFGDNADDPFVYDRIVFSAPRATFNL